MPCMCYNFIYEASSISFYVGHKERDFWSISCSRGHDELICCLGFKQDSKHCHTKIKEN